MLFIILYLLITLNVTDGYTGLNRFSLNLNDMRVKILLACSPPGCGKTTKVVEFIRENVKNSNYKNVVIIKKLVSEKKIEELSIYEKLCELYRKEELDYLIKTKVIKVKIMKELFGFDFKKTIILLEDANRFNLEELKMLMTRINDDCKLIITDSEDSIKIKNLIRKINTHRLKCHLDFKLNNIEFEDNIKGVEMIKDDILRSNITNKIVEILK
tara:strand:+ start:400 stop:1041 length:642 start_codon:yes stop_codon:yes gene_type:complete